MQDTLARTVHEAIHEGCERIGENQPALEAAKRIEQHETEIDHTGLRPGWPVTLRSVRL